MELSHIPIDDTDLLRMEVYILGPGYFDEGASCSMEIITEDKVQEIAKKLEVSDFKEEEKRRATLWKEKRDTRATAHLSAYCFRGSSAAGPVSGSSAPSPVLVPDSFAPSTSAGSVESVGPISDWSVPSASARSAVPVLGLSALSTSAPFAYALSAGIPSTSTPSTSSMSAVLVLSSSASVTPVFWSSAFSALVVTPTPKRRKLIKLN